jgi:hypothetical protein
MIIAIFLRTTGAFAIWYALTYGLSGEQKDPVSHGRKVAAWVAASVVITTPSMHRNGPDLAVFILINGLIWGGIAFVVGCLWRKFNPIHKASTSEKEDKEARAISGVTPYTAGTERKHDALYEKALDEIDAGQQVRSIWARALAESGGDDAKARSIYLKLRVDQLMTETEQSVLVSAGVEDKPKGEELSQSPVSNSNSFKWLYAGMGILAVATIAWFNTSGKIVSRAQVFDTYSCKNNTRKASQEFDPCDSELVGETTVNADKETQKVSLAFKAIGPGSSHLRILEKCSVIDRDHWTCDAGTSTPESYDFDRWITITQPRWEMLDGRLTVSDMVTLLVNKKTGESSKLIISKSKLYVPK